MFTDNQRQMFKIIKAHLLSQNDKAKGEIDCMFLAPDGKKCAVGCLIKPELYTPRCEAGSVWKINDHKKYQARQLTEEDQNLINVLQQSLGFTLTSQDWTFLAQLQEIHDASAPCYWEKELNAFEERWNHA